MNAVDTNILIYAYDETTPVKRDRARELLTSLEDGVLLWQVACEFVAASRKIVAPGGDPTQVWERLAEVRAVLPLSLPAQAVLDTASRIHRSTRAHIWDCMIYAACLEAGVTRLYTEGEPAAVVPGLEIVNPFKA